MRLSASFPVDNLTFWKEQLENWSSGHTVFMLLDSNDHHGPLLDTGWDVLVGAGAAQTLQLSVGKAFEGLKTWQTQTNDWLFGVLGYDLKNEVEQLSSEHPDGIGFPDLLFFQPETVVGISGGLLVVHTLVETPEKVLEAIRTAPRQPRLPAAVPPKMLPRIATADYLDTVAAIRRHIVAGDVYEMNFCQEFFAENTTIDPLAVWDTLNKLARAPMAAFFRWHDRYLLSASPERFLKKEGKKLLSQPIKGTRRRAVVDDEATRAALANSEKDRAENVMIVDLVRNDLARSCQSGTVEVPELFGIYTFETVHQMISTVTGQLRPSVHPIDALQYAFPPGSMTGAPKVMAMELIEHFEKTRRGLYAGALGYFDPAGNFDFNVLIRSVFYHQTAQYVSFQVGGAIVFDSVAEDELDECRVKAGALFAALGALQPAQ
jgi:para-aminobenzoate synthetase component 1